jgi:cell division protein FtsQ
LRVRITTPRVAAAALCCATLLSPLWGPSVLRHWSVFRVERVEVSGVHLLAPHEVLAASGIHAASNVWDDPEPWRDALRAHPVVRDATVERVFPTGLRIRVEERRPVALVESGTLRPATDRGEVLPVDPAHARVDLPLVRVDARADAAVADAQRLTLLREAGHLARMDPALVSRVSEIRSAGAHDVLLVLGQPSVELLLPPAATPERLRQLRAVLEDLEQRAAAAGGTQPGRPVRVDVRFADQVVVRFPPSS